VKTLSSIQLLFLGTIFSLTSGAVAQLPVAASSGTVLATGLNDPRGLAFDEDGALYGIALAFCSLVAGKFNFKSVARFRVRLRICR
jgi:hypothetical protein